ncbi:hypothetical protein BDZ91DRAFT_130517 [Kalaharituber pfeilii]|nr:hypothetical protein BDZ91DRAFT_130517 [Kalaharituber pfeilii]
MYRRAASVPLMHTYPPLSCIPQGSLALSYSNTLPYPPMGPQPLSGRRSQHMIHNFNPAPKADISPTHCDDCLRPPTKRTRILPPTSGPCAQLTQPELELANELAVLKAEVNEAKLTAEISDQIQAAMQEETERLKAALEKEAAERDERERRMAEELEVLRTELEKARATQKASKDRARMMESQYEGSEEQSH